MSSGTTVNLYSLSNYTFGSKEAQHEEDPSIPARLDRLEKEYEQQGMRRSVDAVLLVHEHRHPHILMLQIGKTFFKLPGDELKPGQSDIDGLRSILDARLSPSSSVNQPPWEIGECLGTWYRPNFDTSLYPYVPPHISLPKEARNIYLVHLPEHRLFSVPQNMDFLAVPLIELYDNPARYGPIISALPQMLSRFNNVYN